MRDAAGEAERDQQAQWAWTQTLVLGLTLVHFGNSPIVLWLID
jgi:hypothetical protein